MINVHIKKESPDLEKYLKAILTEYLIIMNKDVDPEVVSIVFGEKNTGISKDRMSLNIMKTPQYWLETRPRQASLANDIKLASVLESYNNIKG